MRVGLYNFDKNELEEVKEIVNNELCNMGIINEIVVISKEDKERLGRADDFFNILIIGNSFDILVELEHTLQNISHYTKIIIEIDERSFAMSDFGIKVYGYFMKIHKSYLVSVLYKEIDNVVYSGNKHCSIIQKYFSNVASDGSYIIAEATNNKIKVDDIDALKYNEQIAILASFTADTSYNMFAAEVKAHSDYLVNWISKFKDWPIVGGFVEDKWYLRAIRADMAIGEEYESGFFDEYYDEDGKMVKEQIEYHGEK